MPSGFNPADFEAAIFEYAKIAIGDRLIIVRAGGQESNPAKNTIQRDFQSGTMGNFLEYRSEISNFPISCLANPERIYKHVKYFKTKMYQTIIPRNVRLSEAPSHGQPVIDYDSKSKGAQVYMDFAREVIEDE